MNDEYDGEFDKLEVLHALKNLLEFAQMSAKIIAEKPLVEAIDDAKAVVRSSINELEG